MRISATNKCQNAPALGASQSDRGERYMYGKLCATPNTGSIFHYIPVKYKPCRK